MAAQFNKAGIKTAAVYSGSDLGRTEAVDRLRDGDLSVIFSVDLFNEGVDVPNIDTVMMLRPTESKILFLQQLGRGLRKSTGKQHLVVLDFIGNHQSFLHKPQALFGTGTTYKALADFGRAVEQNRLELPEGCYVNYSLQTIEFLKALDSSGPQKDYEALRNSLGRRPTLAEFYRSGSSVQAMRLQHGGWYAFVALMGDLQEDEPEVVDKYRKFLAEVEVTPMTKSFKMILLEALLELEGLSVAPEVSQLAVKAWEVMQRRKPLLSDLPREISQLEDGKSVQWLRYWQANPINAWLGGNRAPQTTPFFRLKEGRFRFSDPAPEAQNARILPRWFRSWWTIGSLNTKRGRRLAGAPTSFPSRPDRPQVWNCRTSLI